MGIEGFYSFLQDTFPHVFRKVDAHKPEVRDYHHLYCDINNILYGLDTGTVDRILPALNQKLDAIFKYCRPTKTIFFALDGPGPLAKLLTQRQRRKKAVSKSESKKTLDTLNFTPGTKFMQQLKESLSLFSCRRVHQYPEARFFVSGADREGEGELKIFEHLTGLPRPTSMERCLIVGNDSDLILFAMRAMAAEPLRVIDVLRVVKGHGTSLLDGERFLEAIHKYDTEFPLAPLLVDLVVISLLSGNDYFPKLRTFHLPSVWHRYLLLRKGNALPNRSLYDDATGSLHVDMLSAVTTDTSDISICGMPVGVLHPKALLFILGSKYLPKNVQFSWKSTNNIHSLTFRMELYLGDTLIGWGQGKTISEARTKSVMMALGLQSASASNAERTAAAEEFVCLPHRSPLLQIIRKYHPTLSDTDYVAQVHTGLTRSEEEERSPRDGVHDVHEQTPKHAQATMRFAVSKYLEGICWTMEYLKGRCNDYHYRYTSSLTPSAEDLRRYAPHGSVRFPSTLSRAGSQPPGPLSFLISLLPANSPPVKEHLPTEFRHLLEDGSPLTDLYLKEDSDEQWSRCPETNIQRVMQEVESIRKNQPEQHDAASQAHLFQFQPTLMFRSANGASPSPLRSSKEEADDAIILNNFFKKKEISSEEPLPAATAPFPSSSSSSKAIRHRIIEHFVEIRPTGGTTTTTTTTTTTIHTQRQQRRQSHTAYQLQEGFHRRRWQDVNALLIYSPRHNDPIRQASVAPCYCISPRWRLGLPTQKLLARGKATIK